MKLKTMTMPPCIQAAQGAIKGAFSEAAPENSTNQIPIQIIFKLKKNYKQNSVWPLIRQY